MGSPPSQPLDIDLPPPTVSDEPVYAPPARPQPKQRPWRHLILFVLTLLSTTLVGGSIYSACILAILGAHEMGHYLACRYYRVDASLPYFLPMPLLLTGTLGAFIRIRQQIPGKRELFDIGIAGPIAGFLVSLPVLFLGVGLSEVVPIQTGTLWLGEPLLLKFAVFTTHGRLPEGYTIATHPMAFAAWFGLLATALNLFPIGQLDGGHISYAVLGPRSTHVTIGTVVCLVGLSFVSTSWIAWTVLTVAMLLAFGPRHPSTPDEDVPLDRPRKWLAAFAVAMFVLSFTPAPLELLEFVNEPDVLQAIEKALTD